MSADQHNLKQPASGPHPEAAKPNPSKVRSTRYDWSHEIAPGEHPDKKDAGKMSARSSLLQRVLARLRDFFGPGRSPFDRDDDPDPMAA